MECFVIIVNGWKPLTIITKHFILDVAAALDPPLESIITPREVSFVLTVIEESPIKILTGIIKLTSKWHFQITLK